jgi:hypothetical protein
MKHFKFLLTCAALGIILVFFAACSLDTKVEDGLSTGALFSDDEGIERLSFGQLSGASDSVSIPASFMIAEQYPFFGPIKDQGKQNSCVGYSLAHFMTYSENRMTGQKNPRGNAMEYSGNFIYNQLCAGLDKGIRISDGLNLLVQKGDCTLSTMKDSNISITDMPGQIALDEAMQHRLEAWRLLDSPQDIKIAVAAGNPVLINVAATMALTRLNAKNDTYVDVSVLDATWHPLYGGHALLVVGYDPEYFHVMSSWGPQWGKNGVARIGNKAMQWILRNSYYLENSVSNVPISPVDWKETFDDPARRQDWVSGTNNTPFRNLENWVVTGGAMQQHQVVTSYKDSVTGLWSDGYSSLVRKMPVSTKSLSPKAKVTVLAKVKIGDRNSWFPRVGPVSFGFNFSSLGAPGTGHRGTFWLQNAFSRKSDQTDASKVMGISFDGAAISTWDSAVPFQYYRSLLSVQEVSRQQKGAVIDFKLVVDVGAMTVKGYLRFDGDTEFTEVGSWFGREITDFSQGPLVIQPILGCVGTVCDFLELSVESEI